MSKYLTFDERLEIQKGLKYQLSFGEIARTIGKDRTTIAKEIRKYSYEQKPIRIFSFSWSLILSIR